MLTIFAQALPSTDAMIRAVVLLLVVGLILWFVQRYVPMAEPFKVGITIVGVIFVLLVVVSLFFGRVL